MAERTMIVEGTISEQAYLRAQADRIYEWAKRFKERTQNVEEQHICEDIKDAATWLHQIARNMR